MHNHGCVSFVVVTIPPIFFLNDVPPNMTYHRPFKMSNDWRHWIDRNYLPFRSSCIQPCILSCSIVSFLCSVVVRCLFFCCLISFVIVLYVLFYSWPLITHLLSSELLLWVSLNDDALLTLQDKQNDAILLGLICIHSWVIWITIFIVQYMSVIEMKNSSNKQYSSFYFIWASDGFPFPWLS